MKLIAHRGNLDGPNPSKENHPEYIESAITNGYDVEIDIRYDTFDKKLYLGHDEPQYLIDWYWLGQYKDNLWIHCKNIEALYEFVDATSGFNYFWHQEDDFTLTSRNYIWTYPGKTYTTKSIIVMPENNSRLFDFNEIKEYHVHGVCTDYPNLILYENSTLPFRTT
jgi:hypothetical protein